MTAGDFTGSKQFDLLVRWSDGEVTLYGDVGSKGLNWAGTQMIKPNDLGRTRSRSRRAASTPRSTSPT